jgi:hypothetical protein
MEVTGELHASGFHWTGGWMESTANLKVVEKREHPVPGENRILVVKPMASHFRSAIVKV